MICISATNRRDFVTRTELAELLNVTPGAITRGIHRGILDAPFRVVFPAGNFIDAWPRAYVEEFKQYCIPCHRLPAERPPLALEVA